MWPWSKRETSASENSPGAASGTGRELRRAERIETAVMTCALGPIVDLSRSGMSVGVQRLTGLRPGAEIDVELEAPMDSMAVKARVVRVVPTGGGRYEIALEFLGLTAEDM